MNYWTKLSVEFANQRNYLDELFRVYPCIPEGIRDIEKEKWKTVEKSFLRKDNIGLVRNLLKLKLFPIKDSYVAYLRKDLQALERNPKTAARLAGRLYDMGLNEMYQRCSEPKETNRQIGPLFKRWLDNGSLGAELVSCGATAKSSKNFVLKGSDRDLLKFARTNLGYRGTKGLDFIARFNGKYVIGEAKFLTDFGGHQNAQFEDAKNLLTSRNVSAVKVAILDGVLYIPLKTKMFRFLKDNPQHHIMSALVLREFLY